MGVAILGKLFGVEVSTSKGDVGAGISDMLITALINSNHFIVYERSVLEQLQKESQIGNQAQQLQGAEILITGTITAFETDAGGTRGGGLMGGLLGVLGGGQKKAYVAVDFVAVDFRAVDVRTGAVVAAFRVEGKALAVMVSKAVEELIRRIPPSYFKYGPDGQPLPQPAK
ncbi:CsgG/HfaB family protein [Thermus sp.]|uniref:CsgG/HfaB family protein n=1 Tax=Thermus sp. TaxID=275 RepID=UPI00322061C1